NGTFDTSLNSSGLPSHGDCGNCFAKISFAAPLKLLDYFTPSNTAAQSADEDLGSGGPLLLPDLIDASGQTRHLAVGSGKDAIIYVLDRDNMGKFNATKNNTYQQITGALSSQGEFAKPSYFNGTVYYGAVGDSLKAFPIANAKLATAPSSKTASQFPYPGATPAISANGTINGVLCAVENAAPAVLHAYDATHLATELYNSNQAAGGRDQFAGNKFITAMIANGKVFVGTPNSVAVFGLL